MEGSGSEHCLDVIRSHVDRKLVDHLKGVEKRALEKFERMNVPWKELFGFEKKTLRQFLSLIATSHDLGKATKYFQTYLDQGKGHPQKKNHSLLSALFFFHKSQGLPSKLRIFGFEIVRRHHGTFEGFLSEVNEIFLEDQLKSIPRDFLEKNGLGDFKLKETVQEVQRCMDEFSIFGDKNIADYFLLHIFMSILVSSDREDVVLRENPLPPLPPYDLTKIESYLSRMERKSKIDELRDAFQREIKEYKLESPGVYAISAPTGIGKTIGNLIFAGKLVSDKTTIIYSLPFINIIEQTVERIQDIFETNDPFFVMPFHHLAEQKFSEEYSEVEDLLIDLWHSRIVVTTFVSLLESLITFKKIPFFYKLPNSVLILDEVQAIPYEYWAIVENVLEFLSKLGTTIVLSTATKPALLKDAKEVLANKSFYFSKLNRVALRVENEMTFNEFKEFIEEKLKDGKKTLIITNTIREAEEVYDSLKEMGLGICFLSSRVVPKDRSKRIKKISEYDVCVSTQVVEAGVDISFERVIRDIAPIDSIVQASGRCNRHFEHERGEVIVVPVKDDRGIFFSKYVYGTFLTEVSKSFLERRKFMEEKDFLGMVEAYFEEIRRLGDPDKKDLLRHFRDLNFSKLKEFQLIAPEPTVPFLVLVDEGAESVYETFREEWEKISEKKSGKWEKFNLAKVFFKKLTPYIVNARVESDESYPEIFLGMIVIPKNLLRNWYDPIKGLRTKSSKEVVI
ncbi:CRISPR-associated helicase/endonuclease Cas3 [Thermotoga sp. KOL6]|uniref:CRISPR-associated helicase/endonuclease Cas3 n=1 Tax=Thermotoga sp. KOL6 TaxID=126741 RepID=UPI000C773118|nr:CRISPR-associated helicase/endonuclease Cas3 [Thermotoga sp. KOL6]PLV58067.1 CRISPR-associated protein [Thermotoga sp. KOL6]